MYPYSSYFKENITNINHLMLFKEMIAVYSENQSELINTLCG
jgi:hypothetical protein